MNNFNTDEKLHTLLSLHQCRGQPIFLSEDVEEAGGNCWGKLNSDSDHADDNPE